MSSAVDRIYGETAEISELLTRRGSISLLATANEVRSKSLLLAVASYFETTLCECVRKFCNDRIGYPSIIGDLVESKVISRQYHTWFDWKTPSAGPFFALFGKDFSIKMKQRLKDDEPFSKAVGDFLQLGSDRNRLVHQDFATYVLESTAEEIYPRYISAKTFTDNVFKMLCEFDDERKSL